MALCDFLLTSDISGYSCDSPAVKGAEGFGLLLNRADITYTLNNFNASINLKCGYKKAYKVTQSGKQPFNGTQQEMTEGAYVNTITNTVQLVVLKHDADVAEQVFALANGEFVAVIPNKDGTYQIYGLEAGLHASGAVRDLYNDDTLAGWQITLVEEGATRGNLFMTKSQYDTLSQLTSMACS